MEKLRNINEQVRFNLNKRIEQGISSCKTLDIIIATIVNDFSNDILTNKNEHLWEYIMGLSFIDTYRIYSFKNKKGLLNIDEKEVYYYLCNVRDSIDLYSELSTSFDFFEKLLVNLYDFYNFNPLTKWELTKTLTEREKLKLLEIFPEAKIDLEKDSHHININDIIESIKKELDIYENELEYDFEEGIILNIVGFIKSMFSIDKENAITLCLSLARQDYLISSYLSTIQLEETKGKKHYEFYKNNDIETIILKFYQDQDFTFEVIKNLIDLYIREKHNKIALDSKKFNDPTETKVLQKLTYIPKNIKIS